MNSNVVYSGGGGYSKFYMLDGGNTGLECQPLGLLFQLILSSFEQFKTVFLYSFASLFGHQPDLPCNQHL